MSILDSIPPANNQKGAASGIPDAGSETVEYAGFTIVLTRPPNHMLAFWHWETRDLRGCVRDSGGRQTRAGALESAEFAVDRLNEWEAERERQREAAGAVPPGIECET